ncbi:MAG: YbfB/YjiJ family MFS transporter [Proteobacteria bacterium]|nr:YbfB/YjiJ family MFS transporter [Pseudomonadota bacterium]
MKIAIVRFVGFCSTLVGVGFARMAFTPLSASATYEGLIPVTTTTLVGAMLMTTYALGACYSGGLLQRFGSFNLIRFSLLLALGCQLLELITPSLPLWLFTRGVYGLAGGCLMVVGPIVAVSVGTETQIVRAPLWTFMGIGSGALIAATLLQLDSGLWAQQSILLFFILLITVSVWFILPKISAGNQKFVKNTRTINNSDRRIRWSVILLLFAYTFDSLGYVPATVYLSDYVANQLGMGRDIGNTLWQYFGVGALLSIPVLSFVNFKRFTEITLLTIYLIKTFALYLLATTNDFTLLALAAGLTGLTVPAIVMLTATLLRQWLPATEFPWVWQRATAAFSVGQAFSALMMAGVYQYTNDYELLFKVGAVVLSLGVILIMVLNIFIFQSNSEKRCI